MRLHRYRKFLPLLVFGIVATLSIALAVPVINLNVQKIGEGTTEVLSPFDNGRLNWIQDTSDERYVVAVNLIADKDLSTGSTITVMLIAEDGSIITKGTITLSQDVTAGDVLPTINFESPTEIMNIDKVVVVATGPEV